MSTLFSEKRVDWRVKTVLSGRFVPKAPFFCAFFKFRGRGAIIRLRRTKKKHCRCHATCNAVAHSICTALQLYIVCRCYCNLHDAALTGGSSPHGKHRKILDNGLDGLNGFFRPRGFFRPQIAQMDTDFFLTQILSDYTDGFPAEPLVRRSQSPIRQGSQESLAALQSV